MTPTLEYVEALAQQLPARDKLRLIARLAPQADQELPTVPEQPQPGAQSTPTSAIEPGETDIYKIAGHLLVPQAQVKAWADVRIRERRGLAPDDPILLNQLPSIDEVRASLDASIPYDDKLSDLAIAMRAE